MNPTIAASLRSELASSPARWKAEVVAVNYGTREVQVNVKAGSGPRRVRVLDNIALGTDRAPLLVPGMDVILERIDDLYLITAFLPSDARQTVGGIVTTLPRLAAPLNFRVAQQGSQLSATWDYVPGAVAYELWRNTTPQFADAGLVRDRIMATQYGWTLNSSVTSEFLVNGDFESGTFAPWTPDPSMTNWKMLQFQSTGAHSGIYCIGVMYPGSSYFGQSNLILGIQVPVSGGASFVTSFWIDVRFNDNFNIANDVELVVDWYDSAQNLIGSAYGASYRVGNFPTGWIKRTASVTAPANARFARARISDTVHTPFSMVVYFLDDISFQGLAVSQLGYYYAVRALDQSGKASPFSDWVLPIPQSTAIGTPAGGLYFGYLPMISSK